MYISFYENKKFLRRLREEAIIFEVLEMRRRRKSTALKNHSSKSVCDIFQQSERFGEFHRLVRELRPGH